MAAVRVWRSTPIAVAVVRRTADRADAIEAVLVCRLPHATLVAAGTSSTVTPAMTRCALNYYRCSFVSQEHGFRRDSGKGDDRRCTHYQARSRRAVDSLERRVGARRRASLRLRDLTDYVYRRRDDWA